MSTWQPIETAPKNDVIIVTDGGYYIMAFWQSGEWIAGFVSDTVSLTIKLHPTHWMPLPEPPK